MLTARSLLFALALIVQGQAQDPASEPAGAPAPAAPTIAKRPSDGGSNWGSNYFPNVELITHEGEKVRFFDDLIKDKVVVINFIYTNCPDACPMETSRLAEIQAILGERVGKDTFFYSITIDPERDTPEVLANYRKRYGCGPGWTFLWGSQEDVTLLRRKLGLYNPARLQSETDHEINLVTGNQATGRWMSLSPFINPYILADQIGNSLHNWKHYKSDPSRGYSNAPELRSITKGESVFRTRCAACHSIGNPLDDIPRQGPNLYGVTERREHEWLARWIAAPDIMIQQRDPQALQLLEAHNGVAMPNLRLNGVEVASVIDYLQTETRRLEKLAPAQKAAAAQKAEHEASGADSCCNKDELMAAAEEMLALSAPEPYRPPVAPAAPGPMARIAMMPPLSWASIGLGVLLILVSLSLRRQSA
ncbi:MAG: SCO family protein [Planctomycetota bacterium]|nr:SCO family protein [Planctomycetota bacterium]